MATKSNGGGGERISGHLELCYPTKYVKAADLRGKDVTVVIDHASWENLVMVGGKRDRKVSLHLRSVKGVLLEKQFIVGKTVLRMIGASLGETDIGKWSNQKVTLYPTTCRGQEGRMVECIRVRVRASNTQEDPPAEMTAPVEVKDFVAEAEGDEEDEASS